MVIFFLSQLLEARSRVNAAVPPTNVSSKCPMYLKSTNWLLKDLSSSTATVTHLNPKSLPSALRSKRSDVRELTKEDQENQQRSGENCPDCDTPNMMFTVAQLRSADEGSTVFYHCLECGHKLVYEIQRFLVMLLIVRQTQYE